MPLSKYLAWFIGGCAVFLAFCPYVGMIASLPVILFSLYYYRRRLSLGSKWVYVPLLVILLSIIVATRTPLSVMIAVYLFGMYLIVRILGKEMFTPFLWGVGVYCVYLVICFIVYYGHKSPSVVNYNCGAAVLVFASTVATVKKQWILNTIIAVALFINAAELGILAGGVLLVVVFFRKDLDRKIFATLGVLVVVIGLGIFPFNYTKLYYAIPIEKVSVAIFHNQPNPDVKMPNTYQSTEDLVFVDRFTVAKKMLNNISFLGHGYEMYPQNYIKDTYTYVENPPVHNIPLVIIQQVGFLAAIAWLLVTILCFVKSKWKYTFIVVFVLALFDHMMFTILCVWWVMLIGISSQKYLTLTDGKCYSYK
jgi:hypothetical protein